MLWSNYFLKENRGTKAHLEVKAIHKEPGHTDLFLDLILYSCVTLSSSYVVQYCSHGSQ